MFQGFNDATLQYFNLIGERNNKETFKENESLYLKGIKYPLEDLYYELSDYFYRMDSDLAVNKRRCISSPYNDARFCHDRPIKDYIYVRFKVCRQDKNNVVGFFFDASKTCYRYGVHIYKLNAEGMSRIRNQLLQDKKRAEKVIRQFDQQDIVELAGVKYKKEYFADESETLRKWLDMRTISFVHEEKMNERFWQRELIDDLMQVYGSMEEIYFLLKEALH